MLRRTPSLSILTGVMAFVVICVTTWTIGVANGRFWKTFDNEISITLKGSKEISAELSGQKALIEAAPRVTLTETSTNLRDIQNATLGFQKIFILSMPNRSDKRDAITLSAYLSGLEIEFIDGVDATLIPEKAYPQNWDMNEPPGTLGCWRGHMDVYRKMVRDRIYSALLMEDDVDWDIMIKAQMTEVARGARFLQKAAASAHSPYGDSWDLLVTGHCGINNKIGEDQEYWVIKDDPTVIHPSQRKWSRRPNFTPHAFSGNRTRVVFSPYHFSCTGSYAITLSGAARALYDQAVLPNAKAIDMGLGGICKKNEYGFSTCLGTYPMITGIHHQAGNLAKDSDRKELVGGEDRKFASSDNLVFPVRLNLGTLLKGGTTMKAQYPEHAMLEEIDISTLELPRGSPAFIKKSDYMKDPESKDRA